MHLHRLLKRREGKVPHQGKSQALEKPVLKFENQNRSQNRFEIIRQHLRLPHYALLHTQLLHLVSVSTIGNLNVEVYGMFRWFTFHTTVLGPQGSNDWRRRTKQNAQKG